MEPDETQESIHKWAHDTFGELKDLDTIFDRFLQEVEELESKIDRRKLHEAKMECADVLIILYQVAQKLKFSLREAVNEKMIINRNRKWKLHGDGTAQHIE
jgi:NTP pyrophosphatase (non-canonical NTP hydrolase)